MPPARVEGGEVLRRDSRRFVGDALEHRRGQGRRAAAVEADCANVADALDQLGHVLRRRRLRRVPQPADPGQLANGARGKQLFEPREDGGVEAGGQHLISQVFGSLPCGANDRFEDTRRRQENTAPAQFLNENAGKLARPCDELRGCGQEVDRGSRGHPVEAGMAAVAHGLGQMGAAGGGTARIVGKETGIDAELSGGIGQDRRGRRLPAFEHPSGIAEIEQDQSVAETIHVAPLGRDLRQIIGAERVVSRDRPLVGGGREMLRPEVVA